VDPNFIGAGGEVGDLLDLENLAFSVYSQDDCAHRLILQSGLARDKKIGPKANDRLRPYLSLNPASDSQVPTGRVRAATSNRRTYSGRKYASPTCILYTPLESKKGHEK
jgi:hypothetical protein